jgi:hypothetical protein
MRSWNESTRPVLRGGMRGRLSKSSLKLYVQWPTRAVLLWKGCDRVPPTGKKQRYYRYPEPICTLAKARKIQLDPHPDGPARAAFLFAGWCGECIGTYLK